MNRGQRGKLAMATAALGIGLLSVTGCAYINPQQTSEQYSASDGTNTDLGPLQLRNMMIIAGAEDEPGRIIGAVYNTSASNVTLTIAGADGSQAKVPVSKNSYVLLNDPAEAPVLSSAGGQPGSLVELQISENGTGLTAPFKVPILDGTIVDYKDYLPVEQTTSSPSVTPTPAGGSNGH
ncbi:hypothetical protein KY499_09080 [Arthrobacter sp. PAMC25284]|uniref:DNA modification methylase n=2 Tax=Arthrobacter TaxID=1663 RepID=A0A3N0BP05_9MICC|nr:MULTISPECIES: hypothetical protein [Arthrobacter]QYF91429.1 hypothetical protein KY499_09080 [Arthrobacter sp. PAMC25284]RNL50064.1 hypothetical protein D7003_18370 [Arthrobacter oryzae]